MLRQGTLDTTTLILEHSSFVENCTVKQLLGCWLHPIMYGCMLGVTSKGSWDGGKWPGVGDKWTVEGLSSLVSGTFSAVNPPKGTFSTSWRCKELRMKSTIDVSVVKSEKKAVLVTVKQHITMHVGCPADMVEKVGSIWQTQVFPPMRRYFEPNSFESRVIPHDERLTRVNDRLYFVRAYPLQGLPLTMCIYRMSDGNLWLHCVVPLGQALMQKLEALGQVSYIVIPNNTVEPDYVRAYSKRYPKAKVVCPEGSTRRAFPEAHCTVEDCVSRFKHEGMRAFTDPLSSTSEWEELGISCPATGGFMRSNFERVYQLDVGGRQTAFCFGNLVSNLLETDRNDSLFGRGLHVPRAAVLPGLGFVKDGKVLQDFFLSICKTFNPALSTFQDWTLVAFLCIHGAPVWRSAPAGMYSHALWAMQFRVACSATLPDLKLLGHEPTNDVVLEGEVKEWSVTSPVSKPRYLIVSKDGRCFVYKHEGAASSKGNPLQSVMHLASFAGSAVKDVFQSNGIWTRNLESVFDLGGATVAPCSPWEVKAFEISLGDTVYWFEPHGGGGGSGKSVSEWIETLSRYCLTTHLGYSMTRLRDPLMHIGCRAAELRNDTHEDPRITSILAFWFCLVDARGDKTPISPDDAFRFWFAPSEFIDSRIRDLWESTVVEAQQGLLLEKWTETDRGTLALLIVLDQFSRNIYRGHRKMFAGDELAYKIATKAIDEGGILPRLLRFERLWIIFPLVRREDIGSVEKAVNLWTLVVEEGIREGDPECNNISRTRGLRTWRNQLELLRRFHRFPVYNIILGRENTPEEEEYLHSSEQSFSSTSGFMPRAGTTLSSVSH